MNVVFLQKWLSWHSSSFYELVRSCCFLADLEAAVKRQTSRNLSTSCWPLEDSARRTSDSISPPSKQTSSRPSMSCWPSWVGFTKQVIYLSAGIHYTEVKSVFILWDKKKKKCNCFSLHHFTFQREQLTTLQCRPWSTFTLMRSSWLLAALAPWRPSSKTLHANASSMSSWQSVPLSAR